jgi:hypothetical protein
MTEHRRLIDVARVLRSRSADPFVQTIDIFFDDEDTYRKVQRDQIISKECIAERYHVDPKDIINITCVDSAKGVKVSMKRRIPSGQFGDSDPYGVCPQVLLYDLPIPL